MEILRSIVFIIVCIMSVLGCAQKVSLQKGSWIDLTHDFSDQTVYWPTSEVFKLTTVFKGYTDKGFYYTANNFATAEHGGTHIDAPIHFAEGKKTVDQIPVEQLIGPAIVVDVSSKALTNPDYRINVEDFTSWEAKHGKISDGAIVLLYTGYGKYWPDRIKYMGTDERGWDAVEKLHFPGLHPDAAKWLVQNRKINAIGLDTPSIDYGQSKLFKTHVILFKANIPAFENVANLDKLPPKGSYVFALPLKIKGGSGGPLRIIALIPNKKI